MSCRKKSSISIQGAARPLYTDAAQAGESYVCFHSYLLSVYSPLHISGMQDMMRLLASRRSQILAVHLLDGRILVRLPDSLRRIIIV